ncbi:MAG: hypothetical protein OEW94_07835 [Betaproteobacteria bacterium]|nr:hypothetical protein [Betaproteobacteria bacterium]
MSTRLNGFLKYCLGTNQDGGYQPIGFSDRLQSVCAEATQEEQAVLQEILSEDRSPNWTSGSLAQEARLFEIALAQKHPYLEPVVARALANRWAHGWR